MHVMGLGDKNNNDFNLKIVEWERPLLPDLYDEYKEIAGRDGRKHISRELGTRTIRIKFFRLNKSLEEWFEIKKKIVGWLHAKKEQKITFDDEPDVYYVGKVTEADVPDNYKPSTSFWITLTCQPLKRGQDITTDKSEFNYKGTYKAPFLITLENVSTKELIVTINDVEMTYTGQLSDATVTIDSDELELRVNDELKVFEVEGHFSFLQPGQNVIDINVNVDTTIEFTELFL